MTTHVTPAAERAARWHRAQLGGSEAIAAAEAVDRYARQHHIGDPDRWARTLWPTLGDVGP